MDALIRFTNKGGYYKNNKFKNFETYKDVEYFFSEIIPKQNNYFYNSSRITKIQKDDIFYFSYNGKIVAVAQYTGEYRERENKYYFGYQIKNIKRIEEVNINNLLFKGRSLTYIKTDEQREELKKISYNIDSIEEITIKSLEIENFTLFNRASLKFSKGINVFIGENGTGKSQILKLLYSIIKTNNEDNRFKESIVDEFKGVFRPTDKEIKNLISFGKKRSSIKIDLSAYNIDFNFTENSRYEVNLKEPLVYYKREAIFIPAKEILSNFKGFTATYNKREIAFDKTNNDLALELDLPLLRDQSLISKKNQELEEILQGEIVQLNGEFYLRRFKDKRLVVSSMMAEGLRKIGTISYLLKNGALNQNSILFWDEPESNLNPKLIRDIAKLLIYLERLDVQIFIANHSLFLIKELEILRQKEHNIRYFSFGFDEENNLRVSQNEVFEYLEDIVILDEAIEQSDRFMDIDNDYD
jgi:predicted ATPase